MGGIIHKVHPTARFNVISGTVGELVIDYLAKNGRKIQIIGKLSINDSVQLLVVPAQALGHGFPFLRNLQAPSEKILWGSGNTSNQNWGGIMLDNTSIKNFAWGASVDPVCLTCRGVCLIHAPPHTASATTSFVVGFGIV